MSDILSEEKADKEIIKSLLRHIKFLERRNPMSKILFDENGDLFRATAYEKLSQEDLELELSEAKENVEKVQGAIEFSNKLQDKVDQPAAAPAPVTETPAAPAAPEAPAPAPEVPAATPETPAVPAEEPKKEEPAAPVDPATAPAPAPIVLN